MKRLFKRLFKKREVIMVVYRNGRAREFTSFEKAIKFMFRG